MIDFLQRQKPPEEPKSNNKKPRKRGKLAIKSESTANWDYLDFEFIGQFYQIEITKIERGSSFGDFTG
jgi:hypothetical protein